MSRRDRSRTRLILALDTTDPIEAARWRDEAGAHCDAIKLGLEFTLAQGPEAVARAAGERPLFLDLKLHDIPNTVAAAIRGLAPLRPSLLTIHAAGGRAMIAAAREACEAAFTSDRRPLLLAVSVLTSLDAEGLHDIGVAGGPRQQVLRLGRMAMASGADGLVCSSHEVRALRDALGDAPHLVVPGIRPTGADRGDQMRTATPAEAARDGADWIVVGRPITRAADPAAAACTVARELAGAAN